MKRQMTVTDVTRMQQGRVCVAGYIGGRCVRPLLGETGANPTEEWLWGAEEAIIRPFAVAELDFIDKGMPVTPPHTEDCLVTAGYSANLGQLSESQRKDFLRSIDDGSVEDIFEAPVINEHGHYVEIGKGKRSLGTIGVAGIYKVVFDNEFDGWRYRRMFGWS